MTDFSSAPSAPATIIAFVSGKGGVGKSVVTANLAHTLAQSGARTAVVDADAGQGAQGILFNHTPSGSVLEWAEGRAHAEDVTQRTGGGVTLVQAASHAIADVPQSLYDGLDDALSALKSSHDFVLIDAPAGTDGLVRWALDRADLGILVVVGEPTAIADAYRLARLVWTLDPSYPMGQIVTFADDAADAESVAERFAQVTTDLIGQAPAYLGYVPFAQSIRRSVREQRLAVTSDARIGTAFALLAAVLQAGRTPAAMAPDLTRGSN
jgi:flagellar biosynthesis protein FlhG